MGILAKGPREARQPRWCLHQLATHHRLSACRFLISSVFLCFLPIRPEPAQSHPGGSWQTRYHLICKPSRPLTIQHLSSTATSLSDYNMLRANLILLQFLKEDEVSDRHIHDTSVGATRWLQSMPCWACRKGWLQVAAYRGGFAGSFLR